MFISTIAGPGLIVKSEVSKNRLEFSQQPGLQSSTHQDAALPTVSIIVPTYKEALNLGVLVPRISRVLADAEISAEIIVVDDNSGDGTDEICRNLCEAHPLRLHVRTSERGLSSAVLKGIELASGDLLVVMDADLSHPPEKIPELVRTLADPQVDFVIGSRFVAGGSTASDWGLLRWLNSKGATLLAWPLTSSKDPMAGFFALRRETFARAIGNLDPVGYKIGLELIVKCGCRRVAEVPIVFEDRLHGESKLTLKEQLNYLRHLHRLYNFRFGVWACLVQFILVGATGMAVNLTCLALLLNVLPLSVAAGLAIWTAMTWNFWFNRLITFASARNEAWWKQYVAFCASCSVGGLVNWTTTILLNQLTNFFLNRVLLAAVVGVLAGTFFNFTLCRLVVFRKSK